MKIAVYPGSFDPVTKGHLSIIERAARLFDRIIICVMVNNSKKPLFTIAERIDFLRRTTSHIPNVQITSSDGLLADFARKNGAQYVVKGLRNFGDVDQELLMNFYNRKLYPELETVFFTTERQYEYISSSAVKELGRYRADVDDYLPKAIISDFKARIEEQN